MGRKYEIEIDLFSDLAEVFKIELNIFGCKIDPNKNPEDVIFEYFNVCKRLIYPIPRKVLVAAEYTCPPEVMAGIKLIKKKIEKGENLIPHLSDKILEPEYNDPLLNDWGIYHLHLGTVDSKQKPGFIERTGPLLFARFDGENAYFINVMGHGFWSDQKMIEVIDSNWPDIISGYRLPDGVDSTFNPTNLQVGALRKGNTNTFVKVKTGHAYVSPGGGYLCSGGSIEVRMICNRLTKIVREIEKYIKKEVDKEIEEGKIQINEKLKFEYKIVDNQEFVSGIDIDFKRPVSILSLLTTSLTLIPPKKSC